MSNINNIRIAAILDLATVLDTVAARAAELSAAQSELAAELRAPVQVADVLDERTFDVARIRTIMERRGLHSLLAVPLLLEQRIIGALVAIRRESGDFAPEVVSLLQTFASRSGLARENARLFQELEQKRRELRRGRADPRRRAPRVRGPGGGR